MIGQEVAESIPRLKRLLRQHGAVPETVAAVAESLGPICDKCLRAMDKSIRKG
jgi:hypothetical protein